MPLPQAEPLWAPFRRNTLLAMGAGAALSLPHPTVRRWFAATLIMLWPTFGGHFVELLFLRGMSPRVSPSIGVQTLVRILTWFLGGMLLSLPMLATVRATGVPHFASWLSPWMGGVAFVALELLVHAIRRLRGLPSLYQATAGARAA